jgi:hypothetical protein
MQNSDILSELPQAHANVIPAVCIQIRDVYKTAQNVVGNKNTAAAIGSVPHHTPRQVTMERVKLNVFQLTV